MPLTGRGGGGSCGVDRSCRRCRPGVLLLAHLRAPARPGPFPRGTASALPHPPGQGGMQERSSPGSVLTPAPALPASPLRPAGCGRRGRIRRSRKKEKGEEKPTDGPVGGPGRSPPAPAPGLRRSGGERSPSARPRLRGAPRKAPVGARPGHGGPRRPEDKTTGTARPRPVGAPGPTAKRAAPGTGGSRTEAGWVEKRSGGGRLGVPPTLRDPALPTHTGKRERRAGRGERWRQRPVPSGDRSGRLLAAARTKSSSPDSRYGSRPSRSEARSCQANPFSTHPGALNVQTVSGILFLQELVTYYYHYYEVGFFYL